MIPCILSADDQGEVLNYHGKIMKQYGFTVRKASRLEKIKEFVDEGGIDCIHLDIQFDPHAKEPDWNEPNAFSIMREISQETGGNRKIPIMVISGYIDEKAKRMAKKYGISPYIYKWYPKPAEYGMIALDSIKAINEFKRKKVKKQVIKYIDSQDEERKEKAIAALKYLPLLSGIDLKPYYFLDILENLSYRILANFDPTVLDHFKEIVKEHAYDYFKDVSLNHSMLAEHLVGAVLAVKDENLGSESAFKLILTIIEKLKQKTLSEEEVYNARIELEDRLKVRVGLTMGTPEDVERYLEYIEADDEEE